MLDGAYSIPASFQASMLMRFCGHILAVAVIFLATPSLAEPAYRSRVSQHVQNFKQYQAAAQVGDAKAFDRKPDNTSALPVILVSNETEQQGPDIDIFALMSGRCSTLEIAGRDFACRSVAFFHSTQGRAYFTIALDDPTDEGHVISFSGQSGRRGQGDLYELPIDRMLLNSKNRPKIDGLPVPFVESSAGMCKQLGNFAARQVSSISCAAMDKHGKKYQLQFESDGSPITLRRIRPSAPTIRQQP
jgi:hypothetical protein